MNKALFTGLDAKNVRVGGRRATSIPGFSATLQQDCAFNPLLTLLTQKAKLTMSDLLGINSQCREPAKIAASC
jgi:hypothetical protein